MPGTREEHEQHLRLLSIFHYVVGGLVALFACFPIIHMVVGIVFIVSPEMMEGDDVLDPELFGWLFALVGGAFVLIGWTVAILIILAGRFLARREHYTFCLVISAIECLFMPFGTVLGVLSLIVLTKGEVKALFEEARPAH